MKEIIGFCVMVFGVGFGIYVGLVKCFVGGIVDIINQFKAIEVDAIVVAWALVKIWFATPVGVLCGVGVVFIGFLLMSWNKSY